MLSEIEVYNYECLQYTFTTEIGSGTGCYLESVLAFLSVSSDVSSSAVLFVPAVFDAVVVFVSVTSVVDLTGAEAVFATGFFLTTIPFIRLFISFLGAFPTIFLGAVVVAVVAVVDDVDAPGRLGAGIDACFAAKCLHCQSLTTHHLEEQGRVHKMKRGRREAYCLYSASSLFSCSSTNFSAARFSFAFVAKKSNSSGPRPRH